MGLVCHHFFFNSSVTCTQEQLLRSGSHSSGYVRCVFHNIRSPSRLYTRFCGFFAVQLTGSCDTVLVVLELTLEVSISPTSTRPILITQSFLLMIQRNGIMFCFAEETSAGVMSLHTNRLKTKIQNIGTGEAPRTVNIDTQAVQSTDSIQVHL